MKRINTKRITILGVLTALSVVLVMFIHFPLIPTASFLEYDPADIPIYVSTFIYGPVAGFIITIVVSFIQGLTVSSSSGIYGILMHIVSTGAFVLASGLVYRFSKKNFLFVIISLIVGVIFTVAVMIPANLIITPVFMGTPTEVVKTLLFPAIIPFNLFKQCINSIVTAVIFIPVTGVVSRK